MRHSPANELYQAIAIDLSKPSALSLLDMKTMRLPILFTLLGLGYSNPSIALKYRVSLMSPGANSSEIYDTETFDRSKNPMMSISVPLKSESFSCSTQVFTYKEDVFNVVLECLNKTGDTTATRALCSKNVKLVRGTELNLELRDKSTFSMTGELSKVGARHTIYVECNPEGDASSEKKPAQSKKKSAK